MIITEKKEKKVFDGKIDQIKINLKKIKIKLKTDIKIDNNKRKK